FYVIKYILKSLNQFRIRRILFAQITLCTTKSLVILESVICCNKCCFRQGLKSYFPEKAASRLTSKNGLRYVKAFHSSLRQNSAKNLKVTLTRASRASWSKLLA